MLRFSIKAYVPDVRLEHKMASDIAERFYAALQTQPALASMHENPAQSAPI